MQGCSFAGTRLTAAAAVLLCCCCCVIACSQAAVEVRKQVNQLDNLTTSKAVDALLNAETVALFGNRQLEVNQYDHYLRGYQAAAIQTERLAALLNAGQSVILSAGRGCSMLSRLSVRYVLLCSKNASSDVISHVLRVSL